MTLKSLVTSTLPIVAAAALLAATVASGQKTWDQAEVQKLTRRLSSHILQIKTGVARDWDREDKQSVRYAVLQDVMALHHRVVALDALVQRGRGAKETAPVFRRVMTAVEHARRDADLFPAIRKQQAQIDKADVTIAKLEAYYGPELAGLPPRPASESPEVVKRTPPPKVAAASPDKTFRRYTTEPEAVAGCPQSTSFDKNMNNGGTVRIWVYPSVTGRNEVTSTISVWMHETEGQSEPGRGELVERRVTHVPDLPPECQIRRLLSEAVASCEFYDDDEEEDSAKCDIVRPNGLVRSVRVSGQSPGLDFDCNGAPYEDAYAELSFNPIEVEVVCD